MIKDLKGLIQSANQRLNKAGAGFVDPEALQMLQAPGQVPAMPPVPIPEAAAAGGMPPGAMPPGAMPPGAMPPGAMPPDAAAAGGGPPLDPALLAALLGGASSQGAMPPDAAAAGGSPPVDPAMLATMLGALGGGLGEGSSSPTESAPLPASTGVSGDAPLPGDLIDALASAVAAKLNGAGGSSSGTSSRKYNANELMRCTYELIKGLYEMNGWPIPPAALPQTGPDQSGGPRESSGRENRSGDSAQKAAEYQRESIPFRELAAHYLSARGDTLQRGAEELLALLGN